MPTRRILFVDDDPQLLSGIGKALRRYRDRWTMVFADSGEAALAEVQRAAFDVVVSDMRMPVMDGATLLAHIRDHDPTTIRMILSGFSEHSALVRALPLAHQFFNKPCDLRELSAAVERACELRVVLGDEALRGVIARLGPLPPPEIYHQLAALAGSPELRADTIAAVVERAPGLGEAVLQCAGSLLGFDRPMHSVTEAAARLGVEMVGGLALAHHVFAIARDRHFPAPAIAALRDHALAIARLARLRVEPELAGDAVVAGLVHDLGTLVLALAAPDAHEAIERRRAAGEPRGAVERELLGTTHGELGAYVLWQWGLPLAIIDAVAHHDREGGAAAGPVLAALRAAHAG